MKKTWHIARNELYNLFYSPVAWIMLILFLVLTSAQYIDLTQFYLTMFQQGGPSLQYTTNLTVRHTALGVGFLSGVVTSLYMFLPLITMGLISKEVNNGTIKLLYSSPVKIGQIVLGKYLAMLCFTLCLMLLLGLILVSLCLSVDNVDYSQLFTSLFGLFIVLGAYTAIGLFVSSLTSYQIVAAIITFAIFLFLGKVQTLWQGVSFVRDITYYLAIGDKAFYLIGGLWNLRDFMYCLIITGGFLAFTIIAIKSGTESISKWRKARRYLAVVAVAFALAWVTSRPEVNLYYDSTRNKLFTIAPATQDMLAKLNEGELEVTAYGNLLEGYYQFSPEQQKVMMSGVWDLYTRFKHDIKIDFVYYYNADSTSFHVKSNPGKSLKEIVENILDSYNGPSMDDFLTPEEVSKQVNVAAEDNRSFFVLKYKGKKTVLRVFEDDDFWPSENEVSAALNRLINTPPRILFLTDEIERGPFLARKGDYTLMTGALANRYSLTNQGYDFDTVSLKNIAAIPMDITALVIADPRIPFDSANLKKINEYIAAGGNLYMSCEPDRINVTKPLLDKFGITLRPGRLIQPGERFSSDVVFAGLSDTAQHLSPRFTRSIADRRKYFGDSMYYVGMAGASVMEYQAKDGFVGHPLVVTDSGVSWNRTAPISDDSLRLKVGRLPNDEQGRFVTALRLNRTIHGKEQRVIIASDADYLTGPQLSGRPPDRLNYPFGFWCFSYFSYGKFPANTLRLESIDNSFSLLTVAKIPALKLLFYILIPAVIFVAGAVILIRRKRK